MAIILTLQRNIQAVLSSQAPMDPKTAPIFIWNYGYIPLFNRSAILLFSCLVNKRPFRNTLHSLHVHSNIDKPFEIKRHSRDNSKLKFFYK